MWKNPTNCVMCTWFYYAWKWGFMGTKSGIWMWFLPICFSTCATSPMIRRYVPLVLMMCFLLVFNIGGVSGRWMMNRLFSCRRIRRDHFFVLPLHGIQLVNFVYYIWGATLKMKIYHISHEYDFSSRDALEIFLIFNQVYFFYKFWIQCILIFTDCNLCKCVFKIY